MTPDMKDDAFWDGPSEESTVAPVAIGAHVPRATAVVKVERVETRGRARALQALYAADLRDLSKLEQIAGHVFDDLAVDAGERAFATRLVSTFALHGAELDAALSEVTANWRLERLGAIERSVLRLAAAEFRRTEAPVKVVIQEAVHLAERYGTARSARFVNGVLDAYARRLGLL